MANADELPVSKRAPKALSAFLWVAQSILAAMFCAAGFMKITTPIPELSKMMAWTGQLPEVFVRTMGVVDLAGGLGVLLPALTRIKPKLSVIAAMCCAILQICAIIFHVTRGEAALTPLNFILLALLLFVFWGRSKRAPIVSRG
jgi:uncharacterized membrane protein YphA (DoxX/SURF4 family)